uniref:CUE domain-containing protein n=1 Tax=Panagrolaimus sp. ES5 TaxID=591445 RepID=A0AC34GND9_9BILA
MSHVALDFDEAVENFKTMFPGVPEDIIVDLLRRENGDVEKVVNELLAFSSNPTSSRASGSGSGNASARNSDIFYLEPPPPYSEVIKKHEIPPTTSASVRQEPSKSAPSSSRSNSTTTQNETIDDEKIALMIQNEEFLNYLRNNQTFMREIYGTNSSSRSASRNNAISRPYSSSSSSSGNSLRYSSRDTYTPLTPNGPIVEVAATSIPNGPLVDYNYNDSTIWSKKIMSKLPGRKSSDHSYTDSCNSTSLEPYYSSSDLSSKLKAMSKNSKLMFLTLAKKFWTRPQLKLLPDYNDSKPRRTL